MKERLLTRETVFLGRSAKKVVQKYYVWGSSVFDEKEEEERRTAFESMRCELRLFGLEVKKTGLSVMAWRRELRDADAEEASTARKIEEAKAEIARLRENLSIEREIRRCKDECEALAAEVVKLPAVR
ncbi:hypothetical protein CTAYLR_006258 [Chrysophaeum taylorii]|uniref:Uncharacterized protein n=1 Tax=Chrysophaeum taylorii TaxID=2483200 RepID=A0AAD7UHQ9_9STRA|nr:hypothetical protein CTAYLR_006258 [Chrysophaeum taylorii]